MREEQLKPPLINEAVRRALIEVYTLKEAGQPPIVSATLDDDRALSAIESAVISPGRKGRVQIDWTDGNMRGALVQALTTPFTSLEYSGMDEEEDAIGDDASAEINTTEEEEMATEGEFVSEQEAIQQSRPATETRLEGETTSPDEDFFEAEQLGIDGPLPDAEILQSNGSISQDPVDRLAERLENQIHELEGGRNASSSEAMRPWIEIKFYDTETKFAVRERTASIDFANWHRFLSA